MKNDKLTNPYDLVAIALECDKDSLTEDACMINHPKWESLSHVSVINALESEYKISIPDEEVMKYDNMKAIVALYHELTQVNDEA